MNEIIDDIEIARIMVNWDTTVSEFNKKHNILYESNILSNHNILKKII